MDLQFEKSGLVPSEEWALKKRHARWYPSETISVAIGQGPVLVTPLQLARALSALVEGGRLPTPHLFLASQDPRTRRAPALQGRDEAGTRAGDREGGDRQGRDVGRRERARRHGVFLPPVGVDAGGKTGTAQVVGPRVGPRRRKGKLEDHAWFIGFAPVEDPQLVVVVFVENGGHGERPRRRSPRRSSRSASGSPRKAPSRAGPRADVVDVPSPASGAAAGDPMISRVLASRSRLDPIVLGSALGLSALGVLFIASTTAGGRLSGLAARQAIWIAVGIGSLFAAVLFDYRTLLKAAFPIYLASLVPLVYLLFFGERIANVRSWIRFGGFQFQPAELAKIATALLVAYLFENEDDGRLRPSAFVKLGAIVGVPFLLVFLQPDLGLALTFLPLARRRPLLRRPPREVVDRPVPRGRGAVRERAGSSSRTTRSSGSGRS